MDLYRHDRCSILVGLCFLKTPEFTTDYLKPIGTIYINLLKFLVVPVVLFSITDGVVSLKDLKRVGSVGLRTFVYYMFTTAIAVVIGLVLANVFKGAFRCSRPPVWNTRPRNPPPSCRSS